MAKLSLDDRLNQIEDKISEKSFRENKGLGNEVGYYIFDYDPREELYVRNHIAYLKDRINNGNKDFRIVEFDLFHLMMEILQEEGYLEAFFDLEKENGFFEMADSLVETLGLDETNELNLIISRILQEDLTDSVAFLTGVGKCHPIIASHNILNNLHQVLDSVPVVLFYPGEYSGQDLKLFGTMDSHIYWLFDSGKQNGFKALIYMHRYDADTVGRVRTDYLHKAQKYVETAMQSAQYTLDNASSSSEKSKATKSITKYTKQLAEMQIYDEAIAHIANQRIEINLDDGVRVNYAKFQGVEVAQEGKKALKVDLLAKI